MVFSGGWGWTEAIIPRLGAAAMTNWLAQEQGWSGHDDFALTRPSHCVEGVGETGGQDMGAVLDADDGVYLRPLEPWIAHDHRHVPGPPLRFVWGFFALPIPSDIPPKAKSSFTTQYNTSW